MVNFLNITSSSFFCLMPKENKTTTKLKRAYRPRAALLHKQDLTRKEFLEDMVKFYSKHPRAVIQGNNTSKCMYRTPEGHGCAIGRWIPDAKYIPDLENRTCDPAVSACLPENVRKLHNQFLNLVQQLHDNNLNWKLDSKGQGRLTEKGKNEYNNIIQNYCR